MNTLRSISRLLCFLIAAVAMVAGLASTTAGSEATPQQLFFANLKSLCGATYVGVTEFPLNEPDHPLGGGKQLTIHFASCSETEIRIPLQAGEDKSRTWVLTLRDGKLLLKHDHRHPDGTPDKQTNYGGWATDGGTAQRQQFAADEETAKLIPEAATNVWTIEIDAVRQRFGYSLERNKAPRYRAAFKLQPSLQ